MLVASRLVSIAITGMLLAGCGTSDDESAIREVTGRFAQAVDARQGDVACEQLAAAAVEQLEGQTGQDCDDVITRLGLAGGTVDSVAVYVTNAKVDLSSGDSVFLSLETEGWRLSAIGCGPEAGKPRDRPFECEVES